MSHHRYTPVDELRQSSRFPQERGAEFAVIFRCDCDEMLVEVHDESLAGLGVWVENAECLTVGEEVEVVYAGEYYRARVCHVEAGPDGRYLVGLACERATMCVLEEAASVPPAVLAVANQCR